MMNKKTKYEILDELKREAKFQSLYDIVKDTYGKRQYTVKGLAQRLKVSSKIANHLTSLLGFRRGLLYANKRTSLDNFKLDPTVQYIINKKLI